MNWNWPGEISVALPSEAQSLDAGRFVAAKAVNDAPLTSVNENRKGRWIGFLDAGHGQRKAGRINTGYLQPHKEISIGPALWTSLLLRKQIGQKVAQFIRSLNQSLRHW